MRAVLPPIALITKADVVTKILDHLSIPSTPPPVAPARQHPEDAQADLLDARSEIALVGCLADDAPATGAAPGPAQVVSSRQLVLPAE